MLLEAHVLTVLHLDKEIEIHLGIGHVLVAVPITIKIIKFTLVTLRTASGEPNHATTGHAKDACWNVHDKTHYTPTKREHAASTVCPEDKDTKDMDIIPEIRVCQVFRNQHNNSE